MSPMGVPARTRVPGQLSRAHPPRGRRIRTHPRALTHPCTGLTQRCSLRWRGDQYRVLHGHPAGPGPPGPAAVVAAEAAPIRLHGAAQKRCTRAPGAAVRRAQSRGCGRSSACPGRSPSASRAGRAGCGPLLVTLVAGVMRFWNLGSPKAVIFDETYYAKDAWALVHRGFELSWGKNVDSQILQTGDRRRAADGRGLCRASAGRQVRHRARRAGCSGSTRSAGGS